MRSVTRDSIRYNRLVLDREALLADLNPPQRDAVTAGDGPLLVLAGAGSGKTRVIAHRVAWLLGVCGVHPENVLAVTVTKKGAGEMWGAARGPREERIAALFRRYQERLVAAAATDFDDLLLLTVRLFTEAPAVLAWYHGLWTHVLVDEYQDTNRAQYRIIRQLTAGHRNVC